MGIPTDVEVPNWLLDVEQWARLERGSPDELQCIASWVEGCLLRLPAIALGLRLVDKCNGKGAQKPE